MTFSFRISSITEMGIYSFPDFTKKKIAEIFKTKLFSFVVCFRDFSDIKKS